jgi:excisionase family DNA binding protein
MEKKFITIAAVVELLSLSRPTINRLIARGEIPNYKVGKRRLFDRDELIAWVKGHKDGKHTKSIRK